ncbi:MAG TPA: hypothetical protein VM051_14170 [Usitatibacter sp.]|nr:hypothetical protein [Usitatibacter sp.]
MLAIPFVLAACAGSPVPREGSSVVRLLLDKDEAFRLSRAGVMDPSSPSGLTDRVRYRMAVERYAAGVLKARGLCPGGYGDIGIESATAPHALAITVVCLVP